MEPNVITGIVLLFIGATGIAFILLTILLPSRKNLPAVSENKLIPPETSPRTESKPPPRKTSRMEFALTAVICIAGWAFITQLLHPSDQMGAILFTVVGFILVLLLARVIIGRLQDIGIHPACSLLFLIPLLNLIALIALAVFPPKKINKKTNEQDLTASVKEATRGIADKVDQSVNPIDLAMAREVIKQQAEKDAERAVRQITAGPKPEKPECHPRKQHRGHWNGKYYGAPGRWNYYVDNVRYTLTDEEYDRCMEYRAAWEKWNEATK